jgi:hypothetical protein
LVLLEDDTMMKYLTTMTLGVFFVLIFAMGTSNAIAQGKSVCEGDIKIEDGPHTYIAGPEEQVARVCIKAGLGIFYFECTGQVETDGCYTVTFNEDCSEAIITGGGTDRYCKDISHSTVVFGDAPASESPGESTGDSGTSSSEPAS